MDISKMQFNTEKMDAKWELTDSEFAKMVADKLAENEAGG